jgi:hypothetical protein
MEEDFLNFDWSKIDRIAAEKALVEAEIVDLCEKVGYSPTNETDKTGIANPSSGGGTFQI